MASFDLALAFDYLQGLTREHDQMILEEVKANLQNAIEDMESPELNERGAVFFGTQPTRVRLNPEYFIPHHMEMHRAHHDLGRA
eukprot:3884305-Amphidinium_carterae.7